MILPLIPKVGEALGRFFEDLFLELVREDERNRKIGRDVTLLVGERIILKSPDGTRWAVTVNNAGALGTVAA